MQQQDNFKTSLKKASGLGSSHHGLDHWLAQRFTAVLNIFLLLYLIPLSYIFFTSSTSEILAQLSYLPNIIMISLFTINMFYHATIGMQVVIEDYIHNRVVRLFLLFGLRILSIITVVGVLICLIFLMQI